MIEVVGKYVFDPLALTHSEKLFKPWWCIILLDENDDTGDYYRWFVKKRYGLKLQRPAFGTHISLIRGEETTPANWKIFKEKYDGKPVKFTHESELRTNGKHWWIRIKCDEAKDMREEMGYPREGKWGLHLTIGVPTPKFEQQSYDIMRYIEKFPHMSYELTYIQ
jgi:hypothetical protein